MRRLLEADVLAAAAFIVKATGIITQRSPLPYSLRLFAPRAPRRNSVTSTQNPEIK